jgi:proteasome lid subunit RPN8/RPN11
VETCWTLIGRRRGRIWYARRVGRSAGTPTTVAFDANAVLEREESCGDVLGFFHTHPHSDPQPSRRDVDTMRAWCSAFGKPLLCVIGSRTETEAFLFEGSNSMGVRLTGVEVFPRGIVIAADT